MLGIHSTDITFDQALYYKAKEIVWLKHVRPKHLSQNVRMLSLSLCISHSHDVPKYFLTACDQFWIFGCIQKPMLIVFSRTVLEYSCESS